MPNTLHLDPTRTTTLRAQYVAEMRRRFRAVRSLVVKAVGDLDVLGLDTRLPQVFNMVSNALPERQAFRFLSDDKKIGAFNSWFQEQVDAGILDVDIKGDPWTAKYVGSSYRKGSVRAYIDARAGDLNDTPDFYRGKQSQFLESSFTQPERLSNLKFLYTRSYEELKGITAAMGQQMSRILADGIAHGRGPHAVARDLSNSITGITRKRAEVLARTEIIAAHAEGQLDSFDELGVENLNVMAEWSTAGDDRVCELCGALEGTIMTVDEARGLLPRHPNCRCSWIPANVGEKEKRKRFWTKSDKSKSVKKSLIKELPKKTRAGDKVPQTVAEAKRRSTWAGKTLRPKAPPASVDLGSGTGGIASPIPRLPIPSSPAAPISKPSVPSGPAPTPTQITPPVPSQFKPEPIPSAPSPSLKAPDSIRGKEGFPDKTKASNWVDEKLPNQRRAADAWTKAEREALEFYKEGSYSDFNDHFRFGEELEDHLSKYPDLIDKAMTPLDHSIVVHRNISFKVGGELDKALAKGAEFLDKGYISTTLDEAFSKSYSGVGSGVVLEIQIPKGARAAYLDFVGQGELNKGLTEAEFLLPRNTKLKILNRESLIREGDKKVDKIIAEVING